MRRESYYDILEVAPNASLNEIRESFQRLKNAYSRDSDAFYSLMSGDDTKQVLERIEEAYLILSDPDKRRAYDEHFRERIHHSEQEAVLTSPQSQNDVDTLEAPSTDFVPSAIAEETAPKSLSEEKVEKHQILDERDLSPDDALSREIREQTEWHGELLKRIREARNISVEEMADFTKISKRYLNAIETELFSELPAPVFVRGFIVQIARKLKLPHEEVAAAYVRRFKESKPES